jgi:IPTL-CTERM motif
MRNILKMAGLLGAFMLFQPTSIQAQPVPRVFFSTSATCANTTNALTLAQGASGSLTFCVTMATTATLCGAQYPIGAADAASASVLQIPNAASWVRIAPFTRDVTLGAALTNPAGGPFPVTQTPAPDTTILANSVSTTGTQVGVGGANIPLGTVTMQTLAAAAPGTYNFTTGSQTLDDRAGAGVNCNDTGIPPVESTVGAATFTVQVTGVVATPTVSISAPAGTVPDNGSSKVITITSSAAAPAGGLSVALTLPAVSGLYASTTCTNPIVIPATQTSVTCNAVAANNTVPGDGPTNVNFTVATGSGYTPAAAPNNTVAVSFVNDDAVPPTVSISAPAGTVPDNGSSKTLTITSSAAAPAGGLSVALTLPTVTGLYASTTCTNPIVIPATQTSITCNAVAASNTVPGDGPTNVNFTVATGSGYTPAAAPNNTVAVSFVNDDAGPPTVSISAPAGDVPDNGSSKVITISSSAAAPAGGLSVALTLPAVSGLYASTTCTNPIVIPATQTSITCNAVAASNTVPGDGPTNVTFTVAANAAYTVAAAPGNAASINFVNDDAAPTASVAAGAATITEGNTATFTLSCTGPATAYAIPYTINTIAGDGVPTPASPANLTCGTPLNITVTTQDNAVQGDTRALTLTLGTLPAGLTLGTGAASVTVQDNDAPLTAAVVPTLGTFGIALMGLLIAGFGALTQRRRK